MVSRLIMSPALPGGNRISTEKANQANGARFFFRYCVFLGIAAAGQAVSVC